MTAIHKLLSFLLIGIALSSCSLFSGKGNVVSGDQATSATKSSSKTAPTSVAEVPTSAVQQLDAFQSEVLGKITGDWSIVQVKNRQIFVDEDQPYVVFEPSQEQFYASNGCNIINGGFLLLNNGMVKFSNVISSRMSCPEQWFHDEITKVLADGVTVKVKSYSQGNESYVDLLSSSGNKLMTLRRHNMEMLNGKWIVTQIGDRSIDNPEVNLFFDIPELKVHGNTGCNYFNGEILIDAQVPNSISFAQMAVTLSSCPNSDIEMALLVALEETHTYSLRGSSLSLLNSSGKTILKLDRE